MAPKKGLGIIGTIIGVIFAIIFLLLISDIIGNIADQIVRKTGAIGDPTAVVCFGGGEDNHMHCLNNQTGIEVFSVGSAPAWEHTNAVSTPTLTKEGDIYFGLGDHFCAYDKLGIDKFGGCSEWGGWAITTGTVFGEGIVCFGHEEDLFCLSSESGEQVIGRAGKAGTPAISSGYVYASLGEHVYSYDVNGVLKSSREDVSFNIATALAVGQGKICFGEGNENKVTCLQEQNGIIQQTSPISQIADESWSKKGAYSTPAITQSYIYYGFGNHICAKSAGDFFTNKWTTSCMEIGTDNIPTGIAVGEGMLCFGGGGDNTIHCINEASGVEQFNITAGDWDAKAAKSMPAIVNGVIYFGLGDKVCAYDLTANPSGNKLCTASEPYCPGALWCKDFDHQIETDMAVLPETSP